MIRGQFSVGLSRLEESIELWRGIGDEARLLEVSNWLGTALYQAGEKSRALELFEQNLELARSLGHDTLLRQSLDGVCQLLLATGQFERAEPLAEELGNDHYLADCAQHRRDYALAEQYRLSVLESALTTGDEAQQAIEVFGLAMIAGGLGQRRGRGSPRRRRRGEMGGARHRLPAASPRDMARARPRRRSCPARRGSGGGSLRRRASDGVGRRPSSSRLGKTPSGLIAISVGM